MLGALDLSNSSYVAKRLAPSVWGAQSTDFETRMSARLAEVRAVRRGGNPDPVMDFLFQYYPFKPSKLARWSPGFGFILEGDEAEKFLPRTGFSEQNGGIGLDLSLFPQRRVKALLWMLLLLERSAKRVPFFGCGGMHEWAMVYQVPEARHTQVPLRMKPDRIAEFVENRVISCSHFDAFRFFTPAARPLNRLQPTRDSMVDLEQPGCLHANMDLYRWSSKFYPWTPSKLIEEAFEVAVVARRLDMKASPYDLREQGMEPILVETPEGMQEYLMEQKKVWAKAIPVRAALIEHYRNFLSALNELN